MSDSGYIYVLINYSMANLVKVGKTVRDTEERAKELSASTGVPTPFTVAFDAYFNDCHQAEDYIHKQLAQKGYRISNRREFFHAPLKEVINTIVEAQKIFESQQTETLKEDQAIQFNDEPKDPWTDIESLAYYNFQSDIYEKAYQLYKEAVSLGSKESYYYLGYLTSYGLGCIEDRKEAREFYEKGIENGSGICCAGLALVCFHSTDPNAGLKWFEKYLLSDSISIYHPDRAMLIFMCCLNIEVAIGRDSRKNSFGIFVEYKNVLSPFKEELVKFYIHNISESSKNDPIMKEHYLRVAQNIKKIL